MLKQLALATFAAVALSAASAHALPFFGGNCPDEDCGLNGTQLTGVAVGSASTGTVSDVILPTGEILDVR